MREEKSSSPIKVAMIWDFDLTISKEYQQIPLIRKYLSEYKSYYNQPDILSELQKYNPKFTGINEPEDFFKLLRCFRNKIIQENPGSRIQNGISWLSQLLYDRQPGRPLEKLTDEELLEIGKEIELAPGIKECMKRLKDDWKKKGVEIHHYIVSVGLKNLIEGSIGECVEDIYACEVYDGRVTAIIEDYSKTEPSYEISKGGRGKRDIKMLGRDYIIPHHRFVVVGDGFSDVPSWRFYHKHGAKCILVYDENDLDAYRKAISEMAIDTDYILERFYVPDERNPTWVYLNHAINEVAYRKCSHCNYTMHRYRWSKRISPSEEQEIIEHFQTCDEHEPGQRLIHVVPNSKSWYYS
jgi:hypothetical protein